MRRQPAGVAFTPTKAREAMSVALNGKYFLGVHDECMRSGVVEAAVNDGHYLVRFDDLVGFGDGSKWPEALAVVAITSMVGSGDNKDPRHGGSSTILSNARNMKRG